ncbi:MAG: DUF1343 domain-containing protein [Chloroflexia bacterium]|nr:DUF1343 domain-containing protein [Chloroflexia bacterium]
MTILATGLDRFIEQPPAEAKGARLGLLTNPSGIDRRLRSTVNRLAQHPAITVTALYGPEHGVRGEAQAGEHVGGGLDIISGLPIHSLYGATQMPSAAMLQAIDMMVIDLQDIGARFTTYISTVAHVIGACAATGKGVVILDRPNPLTGSRLAGNLLDPDYSSFVGIHPIPILHGLTIGEFGRLWARDHHLPLPTVVSMEGWRREMWFNETGLPWVPPSPNLPTLESTTIYPGTCLVEGTNLSEGRGTTRPFEMIGAPWIDPEMLADALHDLGMPGVSFRPVYFTPVFSKHAGLRCGGIQVYINDRDAFDAVAFGPMLLDTVAQLYPDDFAWLAPEDGSYFIDKLAGSSQLRNAINAGTPMGDVLSQWSRDAAAFETNRSDILLY